MKNMELQDPDLHARYTGKMIDSSMIDRWKWREIPLSGN